MPSLDDSLSGLIDALTGRYGLPEPRAGGAGNPGPGWTGWISRSDEVTKDGPSKFRPAGRSRGNWTCSSWGDDAARYWDSAEIVISQHCQHEGIEELTLLEAPETKSCRGEKAHRAGYARSLGSQRLSEDLPSV